MGRALGLLRRPEEVIGRVTQQISRAGERLRPAPHRRGTAGDAAALEAFAASGDGRGVPPLTSIDAIVTAVRQSAPQHVDETLSAAERIAGGELPILGHGWLAVGSPPRWHREPVASCTAPTVHWSRINFLDQAIVGDHKLLWEGNRHQHLVTLAQAYRYSGDDRWVQLIRAHLDDWLTANPFRVGVNWASSLECAYRAIAWCVTIRILGADTHGNGRLGRALSADLSRSLQQHARHVARYLSRWFSPNTHLTGEALGLHFIGTVLEQNPEAATWRAIGTGILEQEATRQVHPDGVYFEQATAYHRYTAEIFLQYLLLTRALGHAPSALVLDRCSGLFDVLVALMRGDGTMPLLGDDDGGRLMPFDGLAPHDLRALLAIGAVVLQRGDLAFAGRGDDAALLWTLGANAVSDRDRLVAMPTRTSVAFPTGGLFVLRDGWHPADGHATFRCGPHGGLSGGHAHADALSLELWSGGAPLLVDPGTGAYDGELRNRFRSTRAHNTLEVGGRSFAVPAVEPFRWESRVDSHSTGWLTEAGYTVVAGFHDGYARLRPGLRHARQVLAIPHGRWIVRDEVVHADGLPLALHWHMAPGAHAAIVSQREGILICRLSRTAVPDAFLIVAGPADLIASIEPDMVSPRYGALESSETLRLNVTGSESSRMVTCVLDPGTGRSESATTSVAGLPTVHRGSFVDGAWAVTGDLTVAVPGGDILAIGAVNAVHAGVPVTPSASTVDWLLVRRLGTMPDIRYGHFLPT